MRGAHGRRALFMKYTHVIWDFNGTILDDVQVGIDSINEMLIPRDLPPIRGVEEYREVFDFPVEEYYRRLGLDLEKEDFKTVLAPLWVSYYNEKCRTAPLFPGVRALNLAIRNTGVPQSILSASEKGMMIAQLKERGAADWFDEIWGTDSIHAYGKQELARAWRAAHPGVRAVLIGDTTHDAETAGIVGADCVLVAAGHQSRERLVATGAPVVSSLTECAPLILG